MLFSSIEIRCSILHSLLPPAVSEEFYSAVGIMLMELPAIPICHVLHMGYSFAAWNDCVGRCRMEGAMKDQPLPRLKRPFI